MTVRELKRFLEDCNQDAIVKIAYQPRWAMCEKANAFAEVDNVVYIGGNDRNDYLTGEVAGELGWR